MPDQAEKEGTRSDLQFSGFQTGFRIIRFHVYESLWTPEIGEELSTVWETFYMHDHFAVAIRKGTLIIGYVPAEISKVCWFFQRHGGTIKCRMSTDRHRRLPLEQGGLEAACELIFVAHDQKLLKKLKKIVSTRTH